MIFESCQVLRGNFIHLRRITDSYDFQGAVCFCGVAAASQNKFSKGIRVVERANVPDGQHFFREMEIHFG